MAGRRFNLIVSLLLSFLWVLPASAGTYRLYLKDGDYQLVREHEVVGDRVRYYSTERSQWEEIPLELVDLEKTLNEKRRQEEELAREAAILSELEAAQRELEAEASRVPMDHGVYLLEGGEVVSLEQAVATVETSKKRTLLQILTPVPLVASKATVELEGLRASRVVRNPVPEFYIRLHGVERFMIVRAELQKKKKRRIIQTWQIVPNTGQTFEEQEEVPTYKLQLGFNLYKFWPQTPLQPGEYAVIEYLPGQRNVKIWDFGYYPPENATTSAQSQSESEPAKTIEQRVSQN